MITAAITDIGIEKGTNQLLHSVSINCNGRSYTVGRR